MQATVADYATISKQHTFTLEADDKRTSQTVQSSLTLTIHYKDHYVISTQGQHVHDYTGIRVWRGSYLLCQYLCSVQFQSFIAAADEPLSFIELGAGVGLPSLLLVSAYGSSTNRLYVTDANAIACELSAVNIAANNLHTKCSSQPLLWSRPAAEQFLTQHNLRTVYVIAADIIYPDTTHDTIEQLFETVTVLTGNGDKQCSSTQLDRSFILAYVNRSHLTGRMLFSIAKQHQYHCRVLHIDTHSDEAAYVLHFSPLNDDDPAPDWPTREPFASMCQDTILARQQQLYHDEPTDSMFAHY